MTRHYNIYIERAEGDDREWTAKRRQLSHAQVLAVKLSFENFEVSIERDDENGNTERVWFYQRGVLVHTDRFN